MKDTKRRTIAEAIKDQEKEEGPSPAKRTILAALSGKPAGSVYQGTVGTVEKAKRRAKNKRARAARRKQRS